MSCCATSSRSPTANTQRSTVETLQAARSAGSRGIGWFTPEDQLVSQICIYPCEVNIHNCIFKMGGVTGVGTYPEFAGMGLMNDLIRRALEKMRKAGQYISYLYPYSIPYYRRKGWEIMSDHSPSS